MVIKLYIAVSMKVLAENYKGIEYVRISKLPDEQRSKLVQTLPSDRIIKILRENELLTDCVQFKHYEAWFKSHYKNGVVADGENRQIQNGAHQLKETQSQTPSGTISKTLPAGSSK